MELINQVFWLLIMSLAVASAAWTVTQEEIFEEPREYLKRKSETAKNIFVAKFFYVFTCEYCFSHYVAAVAIGLTGFRLLVTGWVGAIVAWLAVVWVANVYMSLFVRLRLDIKRERVEISAEERDSVAHRRAR